LSPAHASPLPAILLVVAAMSMISVQDATVKYLAGQMPAAQVTWARYFFHFAFALPFALRGTHWRILMRPQRAALQLLRSFLMVASTFLFVLGVRHVPLADMLALVMSAPLIVTALSPLLLGERVGPRRAAACVTGFLGALLIIQPGAGTMQWSSLLGLLAGTCFSLYLIITRMLAGTTPPVVGLAYAALFGAVATSAGLPFVWVTPSPLHFAMMAAIGLSASVAHYMIIRAYERAPAAVLAPFNYAEILGATLLGYLLFGDFPDGLTCAGIAIIVGSGLYISFRERALARQAQAPRTS
jgi:drug/metabolite transporter (DMT)-like permease